MSTPAEGLRGGALDGTGGSGGLGQGAGLVEGLCHGCTGTLEKAPGLSRDCRRRRCHVETLERAPGLRPLDDMGGLQRLGRGR